MIFAQADSGVVALVGALAGLLGAGGAWVVSILKERRAGHKADRADAIAEWERLTADLRKRADEQETRIYSLMTANTECEKRAAELTGEVRMLTVQVRRLQVQADQLAPGTVMPLTITATPDGVILIASAASGPLLNYLPAELVGKNIEVLVPERLRAEHKSGLARALERIGRGIPVDPAKPVFTHALSKLGEEVPVTIVLSSWLGASGKQVYFNAEIKRREDSGIGWGKKRPVKEEGSG